jgi:SAM-dependent methyltransferase
MYDLLSTLPPQSTVLDLGCGSGSFHYETCRGTIIATDLALKDKTLKRDNSRIAYALADSAAIPLADHSVDAVISHHTMEHFADYKTALTEIGRVLKADGWLWVAVPNGSALDDKLYRFLFSGGGHVNRFSRDALIEEVYQKAGLRLVAYCDLFSSFIYLQKPSAEDLVHFPPKAQVLGEIPDGFSTFGALAINGLTRITDKVIGSRYSQYGWGFIFSRAPMNTPNPPSYFNVCRKCGSGVRFAELKCRTVLGVGFFHCPHCKELNVGVSPPSGFE